MRGVDSEHLHNGRRRHSSPKATQPRRQTHRHELYRAVLRLPLVVPPACRGGDGPRADRLHLCGPGIGACGSPWLAWPSEHGRDRPIHSTSLGGLMSAITASRDEGEAVALAAATTAHSWLPTVTQHLDTAITSGQPFTADTLRMGLPQPARVWCRDHGDAYAALF